MKQLLKLALIGLMSSLVLAFSPETPLHEIPSEGRAVTQSSIIPMSLLAPVRPNLPTRFLSDQDVFLDDLAQRTWAYLSSDSATDNHLPWS